MSTHFPLDGLRFIAIVMVVMTHTQVSNTGGVGVAWFFVLSAFLLTYTNLKRKTDFGDYKQLGNYIKNRFLRIYIPYLFILIIFLFFITKNISLILIFKNLTLVEPSGYNTWFLVPLIIYYIIFPVIFTFNNYRLKNNIVYIFILYIVIPFIIHLFIVKTESFLYILDLRVPVELISTGMVIAYMYDKIKNKTRSLKTITLFCILLLTLILFMSPIWNLYLPKEILVMGKQMTLGLFGNPIWINRALTIQGFLFGIFLLFYLMEKGLVQRILNNKIFSYLGKYSYEIYLVHDAIYIHILKPIISTQKNIINTTSIILFILTLIMSFLAAWLLRKFEILIKEKLLGYFNFH